MDKKTKRLFNTILLASSSILYFFLAYIGYEKQNINLIEYEQYENIITDKGVGIHYGSKGRQSKVFYISLKGLDKKLGIYRMSKNYDDLLEIINVGDRLKVYYKSKINQNENINIDLIQVEKKGEVLINKTEYEQKESALIYIGLIAGIGTLILSYRYYKNKEIFGSLIKTTANTI